MVCWPPFLPRRVWGQCCLFYVIFGYASPRNVVIVMIVVWLVCLFALVLGFSRPMNLDQDFFWLVFVESLILAQDERWRRA